ncbi:MAG: hypothetical protein RBS48_07080 [Ignavibacteriaceae bacterium]|jgi:predicted RNase H-like HicB family nuclease|nr:MAG: antitoxin, HicB family protein [bacterium BRH_c32]MDX9924515.1 hypothetical protein [Ignavibacteriaceae bacterium]
MKKTINLHIEKLPEGYYLATSKDVQGLIAQGKTLEETIEIAIDISEKLLEAQNKKAKISYGITESMLKFDLPLIIETA